MKKWIADRWEAVLAVLLVTVLVALTVTMPGCCAYDKNQVDEYKASVANRAELLEKDAADLVLAWQALEQVSQPRLDNLEDGETEERRRKAWVGVMHEGDRLTKAMQAAAAELQRAKDE